MICPKCRNIMRTYDREGVHLEQCESCRGIFLDRGELEQIVAAERAHAARSLHVPPTPPVYQPGHQTSGSGHEYGRERHHDHHRDHGHHYGQHRHDSGEHRRSRSFLEELFDD